MTTLFYSVMIVVPAAVLLASVVYTMKKHSEGQSVRKSLRMNAATFAVMLLLVAGCAMGAFATGSEDKAAAPADTTAQASDTAAESTESSAKDNSKGLGLLAAGLVTGLAGIGGGIAVAAGAPAAIAATSEDPKAFGKALIFVALGESIALYGVVISILILNKV
mgnify:FL=1